MKRDTIAEHAAGVAQMLHKRTDELALQITRSILREVRLYDSAAAVPFDVVTEACAANIHAVLEAISADGEFDTVAATRVGIDRARDGVPLPSVMEAYRVGFRRLWAAVTEAATHARASSITSHELTAKLFAAQDLYTAAMATAYRDEQAQLLLADHIQREALIGGLLHGRVFEQWNLWAVADYLGLPAAGPFMVIAAEVPVAGAVALPGIETKLRSMDVFSVWRLFPDLQIGIAAVRTDGQLEGALALLSRVATAGIGVSSRFDDLRCTADALGYVRVMLRGRPDPGRLVQVFDGSILTGAAVAAPEVMIKLVAPTLECFAGLTEDDRNILFETFQAWLESDGSTCAAGELLFCHPNTVRYRLRRIEQRTGRSLSRPGDIAELSLALEVHRRLMVWGRNHPIAYRARSPRPGTRSPTPGTERSGRCRSQPPDLPDVSLVFQAQCNSAIT